MNTYKRLPILKRQITGSLPPAAGISTDRHTKTFPRSDRCITSLKTLKNLLMNINTSAYIFTSGEMIKVLNYQKKQWRYSSKSMPFSANFMKSSINLTINELQPLLLPEKNRFLLLFLRLKKQKQNMIVSCFTTCLLLLKKYLIMLGPI